MPRIVIILAALGCLAASAAPTTSAAPAAHPPPPAAKAPARANWIFQDCLKRYKDHAGCRYLAYHKRR